MDNSSNATDQPNRMTAMQLTHTQPRDTQAQPQRSAAEVLAAIKAALAKVAKH